MKRTERRHLKENELAHTLAATREFLEPRGKQLKIAAIVIVLIVLGVIGISLVRQRTEARGQDLLAEAMVALNARVVPATAKVEDDLPAAAQLGATGTFSTEEAKLNAALPKLQAAADAYPDTDAGITARYHLAGALAALGRHEEAIKAFEEVTSRAGERSLYGRMARLGRADAQSHAGQVDAAIATWTALMEANDAELPEDAILIELARAYVAKGDTDEARKALNQLVDEHPDSPYSSEARAELDGLTGRASS